jgi:alpha-N-acetylglucosamine transferase
MKIFDKKIIKSLNIFPFDLENREIFINRFVKSFDARGAFRNKLDRILVANQIWENCKQESLISVTTSKEEYLLFGSLENA